MLVSMVLAVTLGRRIVEASERMIKFTRLCAPFSWPGAWQTCSRGDPDLSTMIPQLSAVVVSMVVVSFADSASFDRPDRQ